MRTAFEMACAVSIRGSTPCVMSLTFRMSDSFLESMPKTLTLAFSSLPCTASVLSVGNPGIVETPVEVPLTRMGSKPRSPAGRGGGAGLALALLLHRTTSLKCPGIVDLQNDFSWDLGSWTNTRMLPGAFLRRSPADRDPCGTELMARTSLSSLMNGMRTTPSHSARLPSTSTRKSTG